MHRTDRSHGRCARHEATTIPLCPTAMRAVVAVAALAIGVPATLNTAYADTHGTCSAPVLLRDAHSNGGTRRGVSGNHVTCGPPPPLWGGRGWRAEVGCGLGGWGARALVVVVGGGLVPLGAREIHMVSNSPPPVHPRRHTAPPPRHLRRSRGGPSCCVARRSRSTARTALPPPPTTRP